MMTSIFRKTIARFGLIRPGDRVLVAFSGGQDSAALLALLLDLRGEMPFEIFLAHFNHRLRPSAGEDADFAREVAAGAGLKAIVGSRDVRRFARRHKLNLEEAARILRYEFLRGAARRIGAVKIATGHTLTDQAETMLMRLLRGAGPKGLAGISPRPESALIRPLLGIRREEIADYVRKRGLAHRTDETNLDRRFLRNRIRLELLPVLESIEPAAVRQLGRLAGLLWDDEDLLDSVTATAWRELAGRRESVLALHAGALDGLPPALARRVVRKFLAALRGDLRGVTFEDVEGVLALRNGKSKTVRAGLVLRREANVLFPAGPEKRARKTPAIRWDGKKPVTIPGGWGRFEVSIMKNDGAEARAHDNRVEAALDASKVVFPLTIRGRKPGDRYRPLGSPGSKKLKEILRAKKIPLDHRDRLPVFLSGDDIVWIPGLPVADAYKVKSGTRRLLMIRRIRRRTGQGLER
jgi:tRNA(Ile)-lysidine synthase